MAKESASADVPLNFEDPVQVKYGPIPFCTRPTLNEELAIPFCCAAGAFRNLPATKAVTVRYLNAMKWR